MATSTQFWSTGFASAQNVQDILHYAENLVSSTFEREEDFNLEPTPIGPSGLNWVVPKVARSCFPECGHTTSKGSSSLFADPFYSKALDTPLQRPVLARSFEMPSLEMLMEMPILKDSGDEVASLSLAQRAPTHSWAIGPPELPKRLRKFRTCQWTERFQELLDFRNQHGHLFVPHSFPPNQQLAQWVKRQRYQHKLKQLGRHSTLSNDREELLGSVGFVWDSHRATWHERFEALEAFRMSKGHCNVPSNWEDSSLAVWCKHQRRQYKRFNKGLSSSITEDRFRSLESIGFDWNPRNLKS